VTPTAIYAREGERFVPTELARGPWDPAAQHGGAPAALLTRGLEQATSGTPLVRMTFEFLKPVPLAPLAVSARVIRAGRTAQLAEAELDAGDGPVCRAVGLTLRREPGSAPAIPDRIEPMPPPEGVEASGSPPGPRPMFAGDGMELRFVRGSYAEPGPAAAWLRLAAPLVEGEAPSPAQRVAAAADFGNGVSAALDWNRYLFINPDLTVYLLRQPDGEWVGLDSRTAIGDDGVGLAESVLHDAGGPIGRAVQALVVGRRPAS
jgi:hypothetical protein